MTNNDDAIRSLMCSESLEDDWESLRCDESWTEWQLECAVAGISLWVENATTQDELMWIEAMTATPQYIRQDDDEFPSSWRASPSGDAGSTLCAV